MKIFTKIFVSAIALAVVITASASAAYTHTGLLKMGMTSSQVMSLQQTLNGSGFLISTTGAGSPGMESMYFGAKTKAAVMAFQAAKGLGSDGVVGVNTGTALSAMGGAMSGNFPVGCTSAAGFSSVTGMACTSNNANTFPAGCTSAAGFSPTTGQSCSGSTTPSTGGLSGSVGSLDYTLVSSLSNEEVGEDANDEQIAGIELDADDSDSDVAITSVKLVFVQGTATNDDFDEFADDVSIWLGSTKVGSVDASEFNDDNDYTKTISLSGATVRQDDSEDLIVAISGVSNLDSDDEGDTWTVDFRQVRFIDAQGATTTEDPGTATRTFSFESFSGANDVELQVSLNDDEDDINEAHTIVVDDTDDTDDVEILAFELKADGDSDINVTEIPVLLSTTDDIGDVVSSVDLYHGSNKIASEDITGASSTDSVTFDDLDIDIAADDTEEFTVKVNLLSTDDYPEGTTIMADLTATEVDAIEAEDESGEELLAADLTGTADGEASSLYVDGLSVTAGSHTATVTAVDTGTTDDYGTFKIRFSVTNTGDEDVYIAKDVASGTTATSAAIIVAALNSSSVVETASGMTLSSTDGDATEGTYTFRVDQGETADFELSLSAVNPDDSVRGVLYGIAWGTSDIATPGNTYTTNMGVNGDYKTGYVYIND